MGWLLKMSQHSSVQNRYTDTYSLICFWNNHVKYHAQNLEMYKFLEGKAISFYMFYSIDDFKRKKRSKKKETLFFENFQNSFQYY